MGNEIKKRLILVNKGDNKAVEDIIEEFQLMIYSIIATYELEYGDYVISKEDLFQEGCLGLIEACKSYKYNDETKFSTYAFVVIERRIQRTFFNLLKPYKQEYSFDKYDYIDRMESFKYYSVNDQPFVYSDKDLYEIIDKLDYATELDRKIIRLRIENYSYKEIAKILGITPKKVDNRLTRIKKMFKNRML